MSGLTFDFTTRKIIEEGRVSEEQINEIKSWLSSGIFPKLLDEQIVIFLLSCCNRLELTKKTIEAYYSVARDAPEVFDNRRTDRQGIEKTLRVVEGCVSPTTRDDGSVVLCVRLQDTNYQNCDLTEVVAVMTMVFDSVVRDYPPKGLVFVCDMNGAGFMHLTRIKLKLLKVFFKYMQEALPVRMVEFHIINTVYFIDKLMMIMKPFMNQRVLKGIKIHPANMDMDLFYEEHIPKRCLPEDYGGDLPSLRVLHQKHCEKLTGLREYFEAEERQRHSVIEEIN